MTPPIRYTVQTIVNKVRMQIGMKGLCRLLGGIGPDAPRKWYDKGVPGKHWKTLVEWSEGQDDPWLTYEVLADATDIARKRYRRAA